MSYLGYFSSLQWREVAEVIKAFEDPYEVRREGLRRYYLDPARKYEELRRAEFVSSDGPAPHDYFIFEDVIDSMRRAISSENLI
jgi:hypothetical protein